MVRMSTRRVCQPCKRRKSRCNRGKPCSACILHETTSRCYEEITPSLTSGAASTSSAIFPSTQQSTSLIPQGDDFARYLRHLSPLSECRAASSCYTNELHWYLIYIDEEELDNSWIAQASGSMTHVQLALLFALCACVGVLAPDKSPESHPFPSLISLQRQRDFLNYAASLLAQDDKKRDVLDDTTASEDARRISITKAKVHLFISSYVQKMGKYRSARYHLQRCVSIAEAVGAFDIEQREDREQKKLDRFIYDLSAADVYLAHRVQKGEIMKMNIDVDNIEVLHDDALTREFLKGRDRIRAMAVQIRQFLYTLSTQQIMIDAVQQASFLDQNINEYLMNSHQFINAFDSPQMYDMNTLEGFRKVFMADMARTWGMTLKCWLYRPFLLQEGISQSSQIVALKSAEDVLCCIPRRRAMLQCPWRRLAAIQHGGMAIEAAMSIYAATIEKIGLDLENTMREAREGWSQASQCIVTFSKSFDWIYDSLNDAGQLTPSTMKCAQMIKAVPIQQTLSDPPFMRLAALRNALIAVNRSQSEGTATARRIVQAAIPQDLEAFQSTALSTYSELSWGQGTERLTLPRLLQLMENAQDTLGENRQ